jgi:3-oxoacyl-(acyl-carrier-protein) synthase/acyl carrier protein
MHEALPLQTSSRNYSTPRRAVFAARAFFGEFSWFCLTESARSLHLMFMEPRVAASVEVTSSVPTRAHVALEEIERRILEHTGRALEITADVIDPELPFSDFGVDSVTGAGIIEDVSTDFGIELPTTMIFDYANVRALAQFVASQLSGPAAAADPSPSGIRREQLQATDPIAVIGMAGRFPGSPDLDAYWRHLAAGDDLVSEIPVERWDAAALFDPDPTKLDKTHCRWGGFLEDADKFDAGFFNISDREARLIDPQQRLFLEESWKALEDAGYATRAIAERRCGVFAGVQSSDYLLRGMQAGLEREPHALFGNDTSILAARISYFLNLKGPSIAINTACSSSLVAVHLACQSLRTGECELAIAGGVHVATTPNLFIYASNAGMLSAAGKCQAFAQNADGFVPGEGVGAVVLKRLADALHDGDQIHGVIRASGVNQDGRTNGITAPSAVAQAELEAATYASAAIDPRSIGLLEAHGSATRLGDPIEVRGLTSAFRRWTDACGFCAIGSVKSNIGHAISAAGIAGFLKALLALKHRALPPSLHFDQPNEQIDFASSPFFVNTRLSPWPESAGEPRRAAVSSFGFSGTNAHVVLEQAPLPEPPPSAAGHAQLLPLSARTPEALREQAVRLAAFMTTQPVALLDVAHTLQLARAVMPERLIVIAASADAAAKALLGFVAGEPDSDSVFAGKAAEAPLLSRLLRGRPGEALLAAALSDRQLDTLAQLWVMGIEIDWRKLAGVSDGRKISLPSYAFARTSFWLELPASQSAWLAPSVVQESQARSVAVLPRAPGYRCDERLVQRMVLSIFQGPRLGVFLRAGESHSWASLARAARVVPAQLPLLRGLVQLLVDGGFIAIEGEALRALPAVTDAAAGALELSAEHERIVAAEPEAAPYLAALSHCVARYLELLRGELSTELVFAALRPWLSAPAWELLLQEQGLAAVAVLEQPPSAACELGQRVITPEVGAAVGVQNRQVSVALAPPEPTATSRRSRELERVVTEAIQAVLKNRVPDIDRNKPFLDLGIDSILAVPIIQRVNDALGTTLRTIDVFNYPTLAHLVAGIEAQLPADWVAHELDVVAAPLQPAPGTVGPAVAVSALELIARIEAGELDLGAVRHFVGGAS